MLYKGAILTKRLVLTASVATTLAITTMLVPIAVAGDKEQAQFSFNVYIGATKMFKIGFVTTLTEQSYKSYMKLKPKGLAKLFANITMEMSAEGQLQDNHINPAKFSFYQKKEKRKKTSNITWTSSSVPSTKRTYKVSLARQDSLTNAISSNVPDPLSAFLRLGITDASTPCGKSQRVYDGGKVYDLQFKLLKKTVFDSKSFGAYKGPAYKCQLLHKPIAGYSDKKLAKLKKNPAVFTVWFASVNSRILKRDILLPVAAAGKVKGRAFTAFAKKATFAGKQL